MPNYVKIPREIIYDKDIGDKRVLIFSYLCARRALDNTVAFSITELCHWSNLKSNNREGKINQKYLEVLELLSHYGYFVECPDFEKLINSKKNSNYFQLIKIDELKFDLPNNYGLIYFEELQRILNFKTELKNKTIDLNRMSSAYILLLLSYIRVNINHLPDKPFCCYRLYKTISDDIKLSERYVSRIIEILDAMNIVKFSELPRKRYKKENGTFGFSTAPKIFANFVSYRKNENGITIFDPDYHYFDEIEKQKELLIQKQK